LNTPAKIQLEIDALRSQVAAAQAERGLLLAKIALLEAKLADLTRRLFGPKSEKLDPAQLELAFGSVQADEVIAQEPAPVVEDKKPTAPRKGGGRRPVPENLPTERVVLDVPEAERVGLVKIREEITEEIDYRPSQFIRRQYVRPVYAASDKSVAPVQAAAPVRVIPGSGVGTALIAHVLVSRFCDHLPYYRLEQIAARQGVALERQKLGNWAEHAAHLLRTVHAQLRASILTSGYAQVDETPIRVMDPDKEGSTRLSWLWAYHAPTAETVYFDFSLSRGRESPDAFFEPGWKGVLQSDGFSVYPALLRERPGLVHAGCWAHARRKWVEAVDNGGQTVATALALIQKLYLIEAELTVAEPQERTRVRQARSVMLLAQLQRHCQQAVASALPASGIGKAAAYALERWAQLEQFAQPGFGHVLIDNNPTERQIRPTALGRKNWLFIGHPDAGWRSAVIYSVLGTCKLARVNPQDYLVWALERLARATNQSVGALLPADYRRWLSAVVKEQP
jgi:transposase